MQPIGLYIHVPFCVQKCPYCDFYSAPPREGWALDAYTDGVLAAIKKWGERLHTAADTLYFGGGTPSLLGGARLSAIVEAARRHFCLFDGAEVTLEANPADDLAETLAAFAAAGGNRLSLGMQSAVPAELQALGRRHTPADVERTVAAARRAGIENVSLDLMLGVPNQTAASVRRSVACLTELGATHASAYLLKLEPGTPFGAHPPVLPDEDATVELYQWTMELLEMAGYRQYEISNAAQPGKESRHNLKYWNSDPYLGIGPAASSYLGCKRFHYPRDTAAFLAGAEPEEEKDGMIPTGSAEEYALLRLRLTEGLTEAGFAARFGGRIPSEWRQRAAALPPALVTEDAAGIRLSRQGFLVSNTLIGHILAG